MAMIGCEDVIGGSIDAYSDNKVDARIYVNYPKQEFIYLYHLPEKTFNQTNFDKHQFVSLVSVIPTRIEQIKVKNYHHLVRLGTKEETDKWIKKYGK